MESAKARPTSSRSQALRPLAIAAILLLLAVVGLSIANNSSPKAPTVIGQQTLAEQYGLGVNLVAVTAAGGLVDLRLRIIDAAKAKALLEDQANFPALRASNQVVLRAAEDIASQPIEFKDGGNIFVLYPNTDNAVKPGDAVTILFGDRQVEAIQSK